MGWGQTPGDVRAAEEARAAAIEAAESRPMSPFERKLIGVLEDIRDNIGTPLPEPLPGAALPSASVRVTRPDGSVRDYGPGAMFTGIIDETLDPLLDAEPDVLARAIAAGGVALSNSFPMFREDLTEAGFEKFAAVAIEAALHEAAPRSPAEVLVGAPSWRVGGPPDTSPAVQQQQQADEPAGGAPSPESPPAGAPD